MNSRALAALSILLIFACASVCVAADDSSRLIILGFDGMDPHLVEQYIDQGDLPNLKVLADRGSYRRLETTNPAQSPVAWSCFSVGANPGYTNIFDFLNRIPGTYYPEFAMTKPGTMAVPKSGIALGILGLFTLIGLAAAALLLRKRSDGRRRWTRALFVLLALALLPSAIGYVLVQAWLPNELPSPERGRQGTPFWVLTAQAGIDTVALQMPASLPAEQMGEHGRMTAGLGVPDVRQTNGTFSIYSTEEFDQTDTEMGGKLVTVRPTDGHFVAPIFGPSDVASPLPQKPDLKATIEGWIDEPGNRVRVSIQQQQFELEPGQWSDWVDISFCSNPLIKIHGVARLCLLETAPNFRLYLSPINFDPRAMPFTVEYSYPKNFSAQLAAEVGVYKTLGWAVDTWSLNENRVDEQQFFEDLMFTYEARKKIFLNEFGKDDWRLIIFPFMVTDRVGHMCWRFLDPESPAYDAQLAVQWGDSIQRVYIEVDRFVGEVMSKMREGDRLLVLSDHGFHPFNKAVNINTWLVRNGFMTLVPQDEVRDRNLEDLFGQGEFWPNVDWSRTRAYALGLGMLFVNLSGREPQGIVSEEQYEGLQNELVEKLELLVDPQTGERVVRNVYRRQDVYSGPFYEASPDMLVGFMPGYRVSWQTALGGIPQDVLQINDRKWSGDHCSFDPPITQGVFFSSTPIDYETVHIYDFAPTALDFFSLEIPQYMEGKPLLSHLR
ncbi:MAG: alkaline phosphatase family protein [Candidatus Alcyoniella australis]|nr:alkaline phosphatase family protein [Candidatus Alcyoniella australis]